MADLSLEQTGRSYRLYHFPHARCSACRSAVDYELKGTIQRSALLKNLLAAGLDSSLGESAIDAGFTLSTLRTAAKKSLRTSFDDYEIK